MRRDGFALIAALWLIVMLSTVALDAALRSRPRHIAAANQLDMARAREAALGGSEYARARLTAALQLRAEEMRREVEEQVRRSDGQITRGRDGELTVRGGSFRFQTPAFNEDPWFDPQGLMPPGMQLGDARFLLEAHDTGLRLNINEASEDEIRNFLSQGLRTDYALADKVTQALLDWRDADELPRVNGGEREQYLKERLPVLPANRPFASIEELRALMWMTPELFQTMRPYVTVVGSGRINVNAAPEQVLLALPGITPAVAAQLVRQRTAGLYPRNVADIRAVVGAVFRVPAGEDLARFNRRATFATNEVEIVAVGGVESSPIQATARTVVSRSNNSAVVVWQRIE